MNNYQSNVRSPSLNNHHGNAYTYQNRMDTRRTMVPKEFLLPTFQFKKEDKHKIHNEPSLKFKGYFPNLFVSIYLLHDVFGIPILNQQFLDVSYYIDVYE